MPENEKGVNEIARERTTCAVCGEASEHEVVVSTYRKGFPDLDTRPPEGHRRTLPHWVQRCPSCGYCHDKIATLAPAAPRVVKRKRYRAQLEDPTLPELANRFLCRAMVEAGSGSLARAAWAHVYAVWACDDNGQAEAAIRCREKAVKAIEKALAAGQQIVNPPEVAYAIMADLARRAGQFKKALAICERAQAGELKERTGRIIELQKMTASNRDRDRYTLDDVLAFLERKAFPDLPTV